MLSQQASRSRRADIQQGARAGERARQSAAPVRSASAARQITADAETAITLEGAGAIKYRQAREFNRQPLVEDRPLAGGP